MYPFGFSISAESCIVFFSLFFFFFFFLLSRILGRRQNLLFMRQISLFTHYSGTVHVLFMGPTSTLLKKIKNESHNTIHTFKNYFAIVFSVFSFSNNKFNPNGPNIVFILFYFFTQKKKFKKNASGLGWVASQVGSGRVDP